MAIRMNTSKARHWWQIGESTFVGGMWFMYAIYRIFGRVPFRVLLYPVISYYWLAKPVARRASIDYLRRVQAKSSAIGTRVRWHHSFRHLLAFAETILDKMLALSGRYRFVDLRYVGREPVLEMIAQGRGWVFLTAHMGCLEMIRAAAVRHRALKLNVLVHTRHAERFNRVMRRLNPDHSVKLIQVTEVNPANAVLLADLVDRGEFVAIAADRVPTSDSKIARAEFLGEKAAFPVGGYVLAALLRCPVYTLTCVREGTGHVVFFDAFAEKIQLPRAQRVDALAGYAQQFAHSLEARVAHSPYEWFNFYPFWDQPIGRVQ